MNQMTQNRCGGVPVAHNGNTKTRFFRKPIAMLLLLAALVMAGGKAWGQTTWWINGYPQSGNYLTTGNVNWASATITVANGATVYIDGQITITGGVITIQPEAGGTCTIKRGPNHAGWMLFVNAGCSLVINNGVTIDGNGVTGTHRSEVVVAGGATCIMDGVTMKNNFDGTCGAGVNNVGSLTCTNCTFTGLVATMAGALYNNDGATMNLTNCTFSNNFGNHGGAITNYGILTINGGTFTGNYTNDANGGAIENSQRNGYNGVLNITGTTFSSNYAKINGGAIFNDSGASPLSTAITSCTFSGNYAQVGGAIFNSTTMNIAGAAGTESTFTGNYTTNASNGGGAIYNGGSSLACSYCIFKGNHAASVAGAIQNASGKVLSCTLCTFGDTPSADKNYADQGGAIHNAGTASFEGCSFTNNNASASSGLAGGGAIANRGTLTCQDDSGTGTHCTFTSNTAKDGGGIYNFNSSVCTLTNCVFTSNVTTAGSDGGNGGAIIHANTSQLAATGCTFTSNSSSDNGGAIFSVSYSSTNPCNLTSCVFNTNHAKTGGAIYSHESLNVDRCTFDGNYVSGGSKLGGAIFYGGTTSEHNKSASIKGSTFLNNEAQSGWGGAIYADKNSSGLDKCNMTIQSTTVGGTTYTPTFHDNEATNGGGIYVGDGCSLTMSASDIYKNMASNYGGGVYVTSGGTLSMSAGSIGKSGNGNANTANKGGGVYVNGGTFNLSGGNVQYNTVAGSDKFGAGIYLSSGTVSMTGGTVNNNTGATSGGGVYMAGGTFNLSDGYISYNSTLGYGGGVRLEGGTLAMSGGQIVNNTSSSSGGGVYKKDGILCVTGAPVIKDNSLYDVFLNNATDKYVLIGSDGLQCGAEIGVFKTTAADYKIAEAEGSNAAANANYAMRNGFFFDDASTPKAVCSKTSSPWYDLSSSTLYFASPSSTAWDQAYVPTSGYSVSGSGSNRRVTISTAQGLAYFAHQVNTNTDNYEGATVELTADVNLSGKTWVPIGYMTECDRDPSAPEGFKGTFDGKGHTIYNVTCDHPFYDNAGLFGIVRGGTVKNLMVSGTITNASANLGGIVGEMIGGSVYNCMSSVTPTGGTNRGALVGKIANSGSLYNSFANSSSPLVGNNAGTVANCYVRGASSLVTTGTANYCYASSGSASGTNGTFSAVETTRPYSYNCFDNQVTATNTYVPTTTTANPDKQLVTTLNNWVAAQNSTEYAGWVRPTTPRINGDYPVLKMPGSDAVASNGDGNVLHYGAVSGTGDLLSTYTTNAYAICLYNSVSSVASNSSSAAEFYINEDVAIESGSGVNAHVGITLKDGAWHMFSPAIAAAPLGITYPNNTTDYGYNDPLPEVTFNTLEDGYFPHTDIKGNSYYDSWDYYCYYEPQYHWINFKRNSNSHHHEDGNHEPINYTNETELIPAKGYLLGTKLQTFLQSEGTLNDGPVSIALTSQSPLRTGYNFIGNPYQAYLDFNAFAESNPNIWQGGIASNASYVILESSGYMSYVHGASSNPFGADRYLHPHQGFMVVVKNGATSASFDNDMRKMNTAAFRGDQVNYPLVNLIATEADGKRDITTVELGRPDQGGALKQYDLHLGKGSIYTHYGDDDYAIAFTQPGISEVGIRFETDEDATYTLSWDTENGEFSYLHLIDNITGIDTDCLTTSEYRFAAKTSDYKSRFKLVFGYTGVEENEDGASTGSATFAFLMGNELVVNCGPSTSSGTATLQMFDLMGRMMMERHVSGTQTSIMMPDMPAGVYVLRLSGNNGTRTQKIVME